MKPEQQPLEPRTGRRTEPETRYPSRARGAQMPQAYGKTLRRLFRAPRAPKDSVLLAMGANLIGALAARGAVRTPRHLSFAVTLVVVGLPAPAESVPTRPPSEENARLAAQHQGQEATDPPAVHSPVAATTDEGGLSWSLGVDTTIASTYVFRGLPQYANKSVPSSQSTIGLALGGLGPGELALSVWNATAITGFRKQGGAQLEFDLTVTYSAEVIESLRVGGGYITYLYPESDPVDAAHELLVTAAYETAWLTPCVEIYIELARLRGVYAALGVSHDFAAKPFTITPALLLGLAGYDGDVFHLNDLSARLDVQWAVSDPFFLNLAGSYSWAGHPDGGTFAQRSVSMFALTAGVEI